ncbi:OsmC family protein [Hymenobacter sp. BT175]|uniref:OsmC family protein n=1 Tax=Hymenobacter translucens TaxID=2886507 RepID=UPI001D0EBAC4|nr:OsmC family protein [Hymenobacter translucens]MCC2547616.1 OsmC family protein [Hymenobacter translucens]
MATITGRIGQDRYRTQLTSANGHRFVADEGLEDGGQNLGPTPGELLAASLSACTNITLRMYADRKQWPLTAIETVVNIEQGEKHTVDRFSVLLQLEGELTDEMRQRLLQIAHLCPIHKLLAASTPIDLRLL